MEISEITIKSFKGIEEIKMGPIRPINVLVGRNNSGKSSVLTCMQLLSEYFSREKQRGMEPQNTTIEVHEEFFKKTTNKDRRFDVSVTVIQSREERTEHIANFSSVWGKYHSGQKFSSKIIESQLDRGVLEQLTFDWRALENGKKFGLVSIRTKEANTDVTIINSPRGFPGDQLSCMALAQLFIGREDREPKKISMLPIDTATGQNKRIYVTDTGIDVDITGTDYAVQLMNPAFEYVKNTFRTSFMVSPYRHGKLFIGPQRCKALNDNGDNIVNYLHDLHSNNYGMFEKIADFVKSITPEVGRLHPRFVREEGSELELAYEWPDGRVVNLANMGGGVEQLLILACILLQQKTSCILWEEPESHLHPAAQDILLSMLERYVGDSVVFMTTHSPVFVRSNDKIAVHVITNTDGKSGTGRTLLETELQEAATVLGSRPGHLAMADIAVYIEGKWGSEAFEEWLKKWPDRDNVLGHLLLSIQFFSPDDMGTEDFELAPLKKVAPNMVMFVDRDNEENSIEPKKTRQELYEKCKSLDIPCIITEKRQIEDYFTYEAIKKGLPSNLSTEFERNYDRNKNIGEQMHKRWKIYDRKIAAAMKWEDVAQHQDITRVFEEIKKYAIKLRPEANTV